MREKGGISFPAVMVVSIIIIVIIWILAYLFMFQSTGYITEFVAKLIDSFKAWVCGLLGYLKALVPVCWGY
jgi:hypothetical protein